MASDKFTITAAPGTDIWRKPPSTNRYYLPPYLIAMLQWHLHPTCFPRTTSATTHE